MSFRLNLFLSLFRQHFIRRLLLRESLNICEWHSQYHCTYYIMSRLSSIISSYILQIQRIQSIYYTMNTAIRLHILLSSTRTRIACEKRNVLYWIAATRKSGQQRSRFHSKCLFSVSVIARGLHIVLNAFRARSHTNFYFFFSCQFIINIEFPMLHFFYLDFEMRVNECFFSLFFCRNK